MNFGLSHPPDLFIAVQMWKICQRSFIIDIEHQNLILIKLYFLNENNDPNQIRNPLWHIYNAHPPPLF